MKIILEQDELSTAVENYVKNDLGVDLDNKSTDIDFIAGRGANGTTVSIEVRTTIELTTTDDDDLPDNKEADTSVTKEEQTSLFDEAE